MNAATAMTSLLGTGPVAALWRRVRPGLRILAFHDVPDSAGFGTQLDQIRRHHTFVSGEQVAAARRGADLPPNGVWITFDDGDATVFRNAQPVLAERGIPATAYVCPGLLDPPIPPWWDQVAEAGSRGRGAVINGIHVEGSNLVQALKTIPDADRRQVLTELEPIPEPRTAPATVEEVDAWVAAGFEVGNHTWDHPCLDRCSPEEQRDQIIRAHDWLTERFGEAPTTFAYPNGDRTDHAFDVLHDLGYDTVLLFDHGLARPTAVSPELSRLRIDAGVDARRSRAILSGAHSDVMGLRDGG